jgi:mannonate dehydratase
MSKLTRRDYIQSTVAGMAAVPAVAAVNPKRMQSTAAPRIRMSEIMGPKPDRVAKLARQVGVNGVILGASSALSKVPRSEYEATLRAIIAAYKEIGMTIEGVESHPVPAEKIKLGIEGRDEEIENYLAAIDALGKVGIPVLCYNFMAGLGWYRTRVDLPERGGALTSEFDNEAAKAQGLTKWGEVSEEKMWQNIEYFLKAVIPAAEKAGVKMALHPDDPPLSPLRGIGRICTSAANYRRILNIQKSPVHGVTFCQANFVAMGEDIAALAKEWGREKKIFFVHFRDITGSREKFRETFHDNGPTDMAKMLEIYYQNGFDGPIRPDHAPTLEGEANDRPGYAFNGKIFAFGYMKGIMEAKGIPHA